PGCLSTNYPPHPTPSLFFFYSTGDHRDLHSFPTRRSSDLWSWQNKARQPSGNGSAAVKPQLAQADCISSLWLICCAMAAKPIERFVKRQIQDQGGWPRILERIASGETVADVARSLRKPDGTPPSRNFVSLLLHADPVRSAQVKALRPEQAD